MEKYLHRQKTIEFAVLGAILLEKQIFETVSEILIAEVLYVEAHQRIFNALFH